MKVVNTLTHKNSINKLIMYNILFSSKVRVRYIVWKFSFSFLFSLPKKGKQEEPYYSCVRTYVCRTKKSLFNYCCCLFLLQNRIDDPARPLQIGAAVEHTE